MRAVILLATTIAFSFSGAFAGQQQRAQQSPPAPNETPSGDVLYAQTCASCHGLDGKGHGPVAASLKAAPPDLTTLSKRHGGKFPRDYVTSVILGGTNVTSHGPVEMPVWGPLFRFVDKENKQAVLQRVNNLCDYIGTLQQK